MEKVQTESQRVYKRKNKEVMTEDDDEVPLKIGRASCRERV